MSTYFFDSYTVKRQFLNILEYYRTFYLIKEFVFLRQRLSSNDDQLRMEYEKVVKPYHGLDGVRIPTFDLLSLSVPQCLSLHFVRYEDLLENDAVQKSTNTLIDENKFGAMSPNDRARHALHNLSSFMGICNVSDKVLDRALLLARPENMRTTLGNKPDGFKKRYFDKKTGKTSKFRAVMSPQHQHEAFSLMNLLLPHVFGYHE